MINTNNDYYTAVYSAGSPSIFHGSGFRLLGQESAEVLAADIGSRQLQRSLEEIKVPGPEPGQQVAADPLDSVEKRLLARHLASILIKGLDFLLENRIEDLQLMYSLLGRIKNVQVELCSKMAEYVKKRGKVIVINPEKDKTMV